VKEKFHFHFIDATGSVTDVQNRIRKEIAYQSSMELDETTFAIVRKLPLATELISNARHALVCRLDEYARHQAVLFQDVIKIFEKDFLHIISRQALAGRAIIRSQNPIFRQPAAVNMLLDVLSERGFSVVLDVLRESVPSQIDLQTGKIINETIRVYKFEVQFERPKIRRG
jgi:adenylate kinase